MNNAQIPAMGIILKGKGVCQPFICRCEQSRHPLSVKHNTDSHGWVDPKQKQKRVTDIRACVENKNASHAVIQKKKLFSMSLRLPPLNSIGSV